MHGLACDMVFILWYFLHIDVMVIDLHKTPIFGI